jgi:UDP-N-acetyl-D-glucosamine dehydrogenase
MYRKVLDGEVFEVSSPAVAEMEKIYENTFRHINIALANEMAILCNKMQIDVWEVINAAKTKPYGFMPFYPGPGLGGHCIPVDPYYLVYKARELGYHSQVILAGRAINDSMPRHIADMTIKALNNAGKYYHDCPQHLRFLFVFLNPIYYLLHRAGIFDVYVNFIIIWRKFIRYFH